MQRNQVYAADALPALSVDMDAEQPDATANMSVVDEALTVNITAYVRTTDGNLDTLLNTIRAEVYQALMADYTLGLSFVQRIEWGGRGQPQRSDGEQQPITQQTLKFIVHYRHSYTDTGA